MLTKYATITVEDAKLVTPEMALSSEANMEAFRKLTAEVKRVCPRSDEFIYFVCRAIHAMEYANYDPVTKGFTGDGHIVKRGNNGKCEHCGTDVEEFQEGLWHSASGLDPYINQNGDAFPETELLKEVEVTDPQSGDSRVVPAYKTFINRGLFVNHASDDAEKIRGIILDAQWDTGTKGVDILVACDKVAYPDLARQIEMGYSNDVSMGTQVAYSLCSKCGNKAVTEDDYCDHVKNAKGLAAQAGQDRVYEINNGLNFIEISVVSNGADPKAKIKTVLAALNQQVSEREAKLKSCINPIEAENLRDELRSIKAQVEELLTKEAGCGCENGGPCTCQGTCTCKSQSGPEPKVINTEARKQARYKLAEQLGLSSFVEDDTRVLNDNVDVIKEGEHLMTNKKQAYFQGAGGLNDPSVLPYDKEDYVNYRDNLDKHMSGQGMEPGNTGMHPGYQSYGSDEALKKMLQRASTKEERRKIRHALLQHAYHQGGGGLNDPATLPYDKEDYTGVRDNEDKQMVGQGMEPGSDGLHPGYESAEVKPELSLKEHLQRAKLRARFVAADSRNKSAWTLFAGTTPVLTATAEDLYGDELDQKNEDNPELTNWEWVTSKNYGKNLIKAVKTYGLDTVKAEIQKVAQDAMGPGVEPPMDLGNDLGTEEPTLEEGKGEEGEMSEAEQITAALDKIRSAAEEIEAINSGEEGDLDSLETGLELDDAKNELEGMEGALAAAQSNPKTLKRVAIVVREALQDVGVILSKADAVIAHKKGLPNPTIKKAGEEGEADAEQAKGDLEDAKKALAEGDKDQAKKEVEEAEHELEEVKAEDDKATVEAKLIRRKAARYKMAQEMLYNLSDSNMVDEAHPEGGTVTKAGEEEVEGDSKVETVAEQQDADMEVAEKSPRGELTARQKARRRWLLAADDDKKDDDKDEKAKKDEKPDFADLDDDGNEEESAKEAADDKEDKDDDGKKKEAMFDMDQLGMGGEMKGNGKKDDKKAGLDSVQRDARRAARLAQVEALVTDEEPAQAEEASGEKSAVESAEVVEDADKAEKAPTAEASTFAKKLTQDFHTKKHTAGINELKERMKRAYAVAIKQQQLGQVEPGRENLDSQVDRLINLNTQDFEALEDITERTHVVKDAKVERPMVKSAGALKVGQIYETSEFGELNRLPWK